jgi:hypothetical protein
MARLTLLYTSSAFAILVLCTVVLYWVLASHLEEKNQQFLTDQLHVLRVILQEHPGDLNALEEEVQWEGTTRQFAKYYARILDADGKTWLESPDMGKVMPPAPIPRKGRDWDWRSSNPSWTSTRARSPSGANRAKAPR